MDTGNGVVRIALLVGVSELQTKLHCRAVKRQLKHVGMLQQPGKKQQGSAMLCRTLKWTYNAHM